MHAPRWLSEGRPGLVWMTKPRPSVRSRLSLIYVHFLPAVLCPGKDRIADCSCQIEQLSSWINTTVQYISSHDKQTRLNSDPILAFYSADPSNNNKYYNALLAQRPQCPRYRRVKVSSAKPFPSLSLSLFELDQSPCWEATIYMLVIHHWSKQRPRCPRSWKVCSRGLEHRYQLRLEWGPGQGDRGQDRVAVQSEGGCYPGCMLHWSPLSPPPSFMSTG